MPPTLDQIIQMLHAWSDATNTPWVLYVGREAPTVVSATPGGERATVLRRAQEYVTREVERDG